MVDFDVKKPKFSPTKVVLLTSLPSFILAEIFFAFLYFLVSHGVSWVYFLLSISTTEQVEANMQIFSPTNIAVFLVGMALMSLILCLEIITIIAITTYDYYRNDHIPLKSLVSFSYERMKSFVTIKSAPFFLFLFFFPKPQLTEKTLLLLNIPDFITDELLKTPLYMALILFVTMTIAYLVYRSIFVLHYLFLERTTVKRAFKSSFLLTKEIGYRKMFSSFLKNFFWIMLFVLPIIAIGFVFSRLLRGLELYIGKVIWIVSDWINSGMEFLFIGLSGAIFLAGLTITYIRHSGFQQKHFESRFHFLQENPEFTPRWKNVKIFFAKKYWIVASVILLILSPFFVKIILDAKYINPSKFVSNPIVISHRGVSENGFIENTLEGILEAKKQGADLIEIDVYENKDGTLILSHDSNFKRLAGDPRSIAELSDDDVKKIQLPDNQKVPTLEEVLQAAKEHDIALLIEPKTHGQEKNLAETLVKLLNKYDIVGKTSIHSFNIDLLKKIKKLQPHLQVGLLIF